MIVLFVRFRFHYLVELLTCQLSIKPMNIMKASSYHGLMQKKSLDEGEKRRTEPETGDTQYFSDIRLDSICPKDSRFVTTKKVHLRFQSS